jgi:hypothetical protein
VIAKQSKAFEHAKKLSMSLFLVAQSLMIEEHNQKLTRLSVTAALS